MDDWRKKACLYGEGKDWGRESLLVWGREGLGKRRLACMGKGRNGDKKACLWKHQDGRYDLMTITGDHWY